jgi:hypothetical protein
MAQNKKIRFGPTAITNAASNMVNPNVTSIAGPVGFTMTQPYVLLNHIRVVNKTTSAHTVSMFIGATNGSAAGTEFLGSALSIPANAAIDWYGVLRLDVADFLTALADANTALVFQADGEIGVS